MAKKIRTVLTLQLPAGKATPAPPVGTALGPHGINIVEFTKTYNERTAAQRGQIIPAQITIFEDRSFTFILKTPPAADLLRKAAGVDKGSATTGRETVGKVTRGQVREIAGDQDGRPQRGRPRGRVADHRGHGPLDGHRGRRLASHGAHRRRHRRIQAQRPARPPRVEEGRPARAAAKEHQMPQHGKKYQEAAKLVDRDAAYEPDEAVDLLKQTATVSSTPSVEAHIRLGVDPRHADQMVRGTVVLPHGTGKTHPRRRLRPGREGPGGAARRRRRGRRRGPRQADRGRLARLRRRARDAGHDGHGRSARPHPRPPRPDAEPQVGHDHLRPRARDQRGQGRPRRVQGRQGRHHPRPVRQGELRARRSSSTTWPRWSTRSIAPARARPRASISRA